MAKDPIPPELPDGVEYGGFIKTTDMPVTALSAEQKVMLNRRGNVLCNEGKIEEARRIFVTTGYSDGLTRVADALAKEGKELEAFKLYYLAHNKRKYEPMIEKIADLISVIIQEE